MIRTTVYNLAVQAVEVGKPNDGVTQPLFSSGTEIDKSWSQLSQEFTDAREAWRLNPMARRVIGTITGYVVGDGMSASSEYEPLNEFIGEFWNHPRNGIPRRLREWSKELARAGELFVTLHPNTDSGLCQVRAVPASRIPRVVWRKGDHEMELAYKEIVPRTAGDLDTLSNLDGRWWLSPDGWRMLYEGMSDVQDGEWTQARKEHEKEDAPWMLHYAVNRPVGAVRGEGDLAPILTWLRRYRRWLEDRVRLNSAIRMFLWLVQAPPRIMGKLKERYENKQPPAAGTIILADEKETWTPIAPDLRARDAEADGKAIQRMIAAGSPGMTLLDFGDASDSNLATAKASAELRRRFLVERQSDFVWVLADLTAHAFNRYNEMTGNRYDEMTADDVTVTRPDISVEDNTSIAKSLHDLTISISGLVAVIGDSEALRRYALRLFVRYAEDAPSEDDMKEMIDQGQMPSEEPEQPMEDEDSQAAAKGQPCGGQLDEDEERAIADAFAAALLKIFTAWGQDATTQIGEEQFAAWVRQVDEAGGDDSVVAAAVAAAVARLDEESALRGEYAALLAGVLADYRALYGVQEDGLPFSDHAWTEERAAELGLRRGAEYGIMRGLTEDDESRQDWAYLMAAGRFLQIQTRAETMAKWAADGEARNRAQLDFLERGGESEVWVEDCVNGCADDDYVCRARAGVIMPMGLARAQRLAHPHCTLRYRRRNLRPAQ